MRISIDGNIGSGKSSILRELKNMGYIVYREQIEKWPLEEFYQDKKRWALALQLSILDTMLQVPEDCVVERCPESSFEVFWKMQDVTDHEKYICKQYYSRAWKSDRYVYIQVDPQTCHDRISTREQDGDNYISLEYLSEIDEHYKSFVSNRDVIVIDGNKHLQDVVKEVVKVLEV
jgi:deoxyadenosine/deoxycytidine kinase